MFKIVLNGEFTYQALAWWFDENNEEFITADKTKAMLEEAAGNDLDVDISSVGGFVDVATDMILMFREYKRNYPNAKMTLNIKGMAASAASFFAAAEFWDSITVEDISTWMAHRPFSCICGDYETFQSQADSLMRATKMYANVYSQRSKIKLEKMLELMRKTTYLYGQEIIDNGFADSIKQSGQKIDRDSAIAALETKQKTAMKHVKEAEQEENYFEKIAAKLNKFEDNNKMVFSSIKPKNPASGGDNNSREEKIMDVKELEKEHPEIHSAVMKAGEEKGAIDERARVDEIRKIMKDESFSWCKDAMTICDEAITNGTSAFDCKMKVNAEIAKLMSDPSKRNQMLSDMDSPGAIGGQGGDDGELKDKDERFQPGKF